MEAYGGPLLVDMQPYGHFIHLLDYVIRRSENLRFVKKKKLVWEEIGDIFPNTGILLLA